MKVGILTFHFSDNFGALLQAYALRKWFMVNGHEAEFIPYHPSHVESGGAMQMSLRPAAVKANLKTVFLKVTAFLQRYFGDKDQAARFQEFRTKELGISRTFLRRASELEVISSRYDLIVAGSDQIWSPSIQFGFDPCYFLSFANRSTARCISYAASFGRDSLTPHQMELVAPLLESLSSISVRELSGVDIVRGASGLEAACVPDPTLLHDKYDELLDSSNDDSNGHIFCYALRTADVIREVSETAAAALSAPIISPHNVHRRWREIGQTVYPGPAEWVSQLVNASFVVTNSFHGTVFSVLFRKPFLVTELPGSRKAMNARSRNFLAQLGLMDRFVSKNELSKVPELIHSPIDWSNVAVRQEALRVTGASFLENELERTMQP